MAELPDRRLYGELGLVNLLQLIPSMHNYYRQKGLCPVRAACGKTARAVRKGGRRQRLITATSPDPTVVKLLLIWGGGGAKGPAHQECRFVQPGPSGSGRKRR